MNKIACEAHHRGKKYGFISKSANLHTILIMAPLFLYTTIKDILFRMYGNCVSLNIPLKFLMMVFFFFKASHSTIKFACKP